MLCRSPPAEDLRRDLDRCVDFAASTDKSPPAIRSTGRPTGGQTMIVIGADTHKSSHTVAAVEAVTGRSLAERTVSARGTSFDLLLAWARGHGAERVWA